MTQTPHPVGIMTQTPHPGQDPGRAHCRARRRTMPRASNPGCRECGRSTP